MGTVIDRLYFFNLTSPAKVDYLVFTAGLLTSSNPQRLPVFLDSGLLLLINAFHSCATAPDFHRIPYSSCI